MFLTAMVVMIMAFIEVSKETAIKGECNALTLLWGKAILSEYDVNLYNDYGIMGFHGNESDVNEKLEKYCKFTFDNRKSINYSNVETVLGEYRLSSLNNFSEEIDKRMLLCTIDTFKNKRKFRKEDEYTGIEVKNNYVLETLPSTNYEKSNSIMALKSMLVKGMSFEDITNDCFGLVYIMKYFNNNIYLRDEKETIFRNEWEYILCGKANDEKNFNSAKRKIWLLRNALNLGYLYQDNEKRQLALTVAELIAPGPWMVAVHFLILETWALIETDYDLDQLIKGEGVVLIKTGDSWHTDLDTVIDGDLFKDNLNDEEKIKLNEERHNMSNLNEGTELGVNSEMDYEKYLLMFLSTMNQDTRLLRMMDLIQMNMKLRYYRDFDLAEYNNGLTYGITVNNKEYEMNVKY